MSQPFVGEIRIFAGSFAPVGWMFCDGALLPISENETLFNLIGTTYGGDGQETFRLPDLQGRIPLHMGTGPGLTNRILAESGGAEDVTLTVNQIPPHNHQAMAATGLGHLSEPQGAVPAAHRDFTVFDLNTNVAMAATAIQAAGGSQPHTNMPPYLCVHFIISLFGIFPTPS